SSTRDRALRPVPDPLLAGVSQLGRRAAPSARASGPRLARRRPGGGLTCPAGALAFRSFRTAGITPQCLLGLDAALGDRELTDSRCARWPGVCPGSAVTLGWN